MIKLWKQNKLWQFIITRITGVITWSMFAITHVGLEIGLYNKKCSKCPLFLSLLRSFFSWYKGPIFRHIPILNLLQSLRSLLSIHMMQTAVIWTFLPHSLSPEIKFEMRGGLNLREGSQWCLGGCELTYYRNSYPGIWDDLRWHEICCNQCRHSFHRLSGYIF